MSLRLRMLRWLLARLPEWLGRWIACRIGDLCYRFLPVSRRHGLRNMRQVLGARASRAIVRRSVRQVFRNVALNYYDMVRVSDLSAAVMAQKVVFDDAGWEPVQTYLREGRSIIVVSAHFGAIDIVGRILEVRGYHPALVVDRVGSPALFDLMNALRTRNGWNVFIYEEGLAVLRRLLALLAGGHFVFILADRNAKQAGIAVPFFGRPAVINTAIARLALRSGAVVVPAFCYREGTQYIVRIEPALNPPGSPPPSLESLTQQIAATCEQYIRLHPEQWLLLTPVWAGAAPQPGTPAAQREHQPQR
jgi:lauroyl/myristoyl acyltransferase